MASLLLNFSIASVSCGLDAQSHCLTALATVGAGAITDGEARYRALVAMGTILNQGDPANLVHAKEYGLSAAVSDWMETAKRNGGAEAGKVAECAGFVAASL